MEKYANILVINVFIAGVFMGIFLKELSLFINKKLDDKTIKTQDEIIKAQDEIINRIIKKNTKGE